LTSVAGSSSSSANRLKFTAFHFLGESPFLAGIAVPLSRGTQPALVVWNLLTLSVWWSLKLPGAYGVLAGDAASGRFAVATRGAPVAAALPLQSDGEAPSDTDASVSVPGYVMLFGSGSYLPAAAWRCPSNATVAALAFAHPGTEMAAKFKGVSGASPLLLLTSSRDFSILGTRVDEHLEGKKPGGDVPGADYAADSGLNSIFGSGLSSGPAPMDVGEDGFISMDWRKLLDAPSHALPLISDLCPVILESMLLNMEGQA
jgi:hypothetical protein